MLSQLLMFISAFFFTTSQLFFFQSIMQVKKENIAIYRDAIIWQHLNALSFCSLSSNHCGLYDGMVIPQQDFQLTYYANLDYNKIPPVITCVNNGYLYTFATKVGISEIVKRYNLSDKEIAASVKGRSGTEFFYIDENAQEYGKDSIGYNTIPEDICRDEHETYKKSQLEFILVNYIGLL